MKNNNWQTDLETYICQGEPDKVEKTNNSWYFRNALVRANYNNWENDIHETTKYLELFFENLLMNKHHKLKNRYVHIDYKNRE